MTAVVALNYYYRILVLADCRVSWTNGLGLRLQDNIQKLYPVGNIGILGFSGDLIMAKRVMSSIRRQSLPGHGLALAEGLARIAREEFTRARDSEKTRLQLMFAGIRDFQPSLRATNVDVFPVGLFEFESPGFEVKECDPVVTLGYAKELPLETILQLRDETLSYGLDSTTKSFQTAVNIASLGADLAHIGGGQVGHFFVAGSVDLEGVTWQTYGNDDGIHLEIEDGKFILADPVNEQRITLKTIFEYDPENADPKEIVIGSPFEGL